MRIYVKRSFKSIKCDTNKINEYKKRKSKNRLLTEIKGVAKLNLFNFELAYTNNRSKLTEPFNEPVRVDRFGLFQWTLGSLLISQKGKNPTITIYNPFTESIINNICYGYHFSLNPVK